MKRFLSTLVVLSMLLTVVGVPQTTYADDYTPYEEQFFDFAGGASIENYFQNNAAIDYTGAVERVDGTAIKLYSSDQITLPSLTIDLNNSARYKNLNIEFDLKYNPSGNADFEITTETSNKIFRVFANNAASPCINSGSNRFSTSVSKWWDNNAANGYHRIRLEITSLGNNNTVALYIDGNKGDTEYTSWLGLDTLKFALNSVSGVAYLDNIRIYDRQFAQYDNTGLSASSVFSPFVGRTLVYDYNSALTVSSVVLNGTTLTKDADYSVNAAGRLKLNSSNFKSTGTYGLAVTFVNNGAPYTELIDIVIGNVSPTVITVSDLTTTGNYSVLPSPSNINTAQSSAGTWSRTSDSSWKSFSMYAADSVSPYYIRLNTSTGTLAKDTYSLTFLNLPVGTFNVEYAGYNIANNRNRHPNVDFSGGTGFVKEGVDPYSSSKEYIELGNITFTNSNNTLKVTAASSQTNKASDAIMMVFGIRLTPVVTSEGEIISYFETGKTIMASINEAADASELQAITEAIGEYIGVDADALSNMTAVYEALIAEKPFEDTDEYKAAFNNAVKAMCTPVNLAKVRTLEDLRLVNSNFYVRNYVPNDISSNRPYYAYYQLELDGLKALELSFNATKATQFTVEASLSAIPVSSGAPVSDADQINELEAFVNGYSSAIEGIVVTTTANQATTVDLTELVSLANNASFDDLTIRLTSTYGFKNDVSNITLNGYYEVTGGIKDYYTIDGVSYVNLSEAEGGYVGSCYVTKNKVYAGDAKLIIATYSDNELIDICSKDLTALPTGESIRITVNGYTKAYQPACVRVYVWEMENINPYADDLIIDAPRHDGESGWYWKDGKFKKEDGSFVER